MAEDSNSIKCLTEIQAHQRAAQIWFGSVHYRLELALSKGSGGYSGKLSVTFSLKHTAADLFFDFRLGKILRLSVNSKAAPISWNELHLNIAKELLVEGHNAIEIEYQSPYQSDGTGLHSTVDSDGLQYLYTQCEVYSCNKLFPCFDQPDLKAYLELSIKAPADWTVLSNETGVV